jgi:hypothetical protein
MSSPYSTNKHLLQQAKCFTWTWVDETFWLVLKCFQGIVENEVGSCLEEFGKFQTVKRFVCWRKSDYQVLKRDANNLLMDENQLRGQTGANCDVIQWVKIAKIERK